MLLWLGKAAGVSPALMANVRRAAARESTLQRQSGAVRKLLPWKVVARAMWKKKWPAK